ncbi:hypothetical protein RAS1_33180 [Phycisphaerae bacterium RAS1]|nr:hypothetical protein RAS1_33180 [Phycisphaerae bacterium RAS1]
MPPPPGAGDRASWIKLKVVDDESGNPLPGVVLSVTQPNGKAFDFTTRPDGAVEVHGIDPGECSVTCDLTGATIADTHDFVVMADRPTWTQSTESSDAAAGAGSAPADSNALPRTQSASRSGVRIANVEAHKVSTGETLQSLAESNGLTWQQLAQFNWGTSVPDEINKKLHDEVGCTQKAADGVNYRFDDADSPGIVRIPTRWSVQGLVTDQTHTIRVQAADRDSAGNGYIRLYVFDADGQPIADAACTIKSKTGQVVFEGVTDAQGRLRKDGVDFDDFTLLMDGNERVVPSVAYNDEWVDVLMPRPGRIRLLVLDASDQPLADAEFTLADNKSGRAFSGRTDAEGRIRRDGVELNDYKLTVGSFDRIVPAVAYDDEWIDVFSTGSPARSDASDASDNPEMRLAA